MELLERIERHVRRHDLIPPGGEVTCLVSGGPDSACLHGALRELGYAVSAVHVNHKLRGAESEDDARFCAEQLGAEVIDADGTGASEAQLREGRSCLVPRSALEIGPLMDDSGVIEERGPLPNEYRPAT